MEQHLHFPVPGSIQAHPTKQITENFALQPAGGPTISQRPARLSFTHLFPYLQTGIL